MILVGANNFDDALTTIQKQTRIAVDTETTGLYPFHGDRLFSIIVSTPSEDYYFNFNIGGMPKSLLKQVEQAVNVVDYIYFCNAKYDLSILYQDGIEIDKPTILDIPSLARIHYSKHKSGFMSLEYLAEFYLKTEFKDKAVEEYIKKNNLYILDHRDNKKPQFNLVPLNLMVPYACKDARLTFKIGEFIIEKINYRDQLYKTQRTKKIPLLMDLLKQETELTKALFSMKKAGFLTDISYIKAALSREIKLENTYYEVIKTKMGEAFNPNSPKQLVKYLLSQGIQLTEKTPTGGFKCDVNVLEGVELPIVKTIVKMKQSSKRANTYYKNFIELADKDNILHCEVNQETATTGRTSSTSPNLQNLPKEDYHEWAVRNSFIPRPGHILFFLDYKQQEMLFMADQAGEISLINKVKDGVDFFDAIVEVIYNLTGIKLERSKAKKISYGISYGEGKDLLAKNLGCTPDQAVKFKRVFFEGLSQIKRLQVMLQNQVKYYGKIHNPYGRVTFLSKNEEYKALNAFVQGGCADMTKRAVVNLDKFLKSYKSNLILAVHDEPVFEIHKEETQLISKLKAIMIEAYPYKYMPMGVDVSFSTTSWGAKKPLTQK